MLSGINLHVDVFPYKKSDLSVHINRSFYSNYLSLMKCYTMNIEYHVPIFSFLHDVI